MCILPEKAVPKMTYIVSGGTLNPTHSLTHSLNICLSVMMFHVKKIFQKQKFWTWIIVIYIIIHFCSSQVSLKSNLDVQFKAQDPTVIAGDASYYCSVSYCDVTTFYRCDWQICHVPLYSILSLRELFHKLCLSLILIAIVTSVFCRPNETTVN